MKVKTCKSCQYPHEGRACSNPACYANPAVPDATKAAWRERDAKERIAEEERAFLRRAWGQSFSK